MSSYDLLRRRNRRNDTIYNNSLSNYSTTQNVSRENNRSNLNLQIDTTNLERPFTTHVPVVTHVIQGDEEGYFTQGMSHFNSNNLPFTTLQNSTLLNPNYYIFPVRTSLPLEYKEPELFRQRIIDDNGDINFRYPLTQNEIKCLR